MFKTKHTIIAVSIAASLCSWLIDAGVDSFVFNQSTFPDNLFLEASPYQLYSRSLLSFFIILFGLVISRLISKRDRGDEILKKHAAAIESSMDGIAIYNDSDQYVFVNQAYALINGYEGTNDIVGKSCQHIYGDKEHERMERTVIPVLKKNGKWRGELIARRKNGSTYFQEASIAMLEDGWRVCIVRDITWRKRSGERLQRSERFLNTIFNSIRDPFCIFDDEFRIIRVNEAYAQLKNKSLGDLIGRKCYEVLEGKRDVCDGCVVDKTFHSADPCAKDKLVSLHDGTQSWVEIFTYPILEEEGTVTHVIEYTRDVTERKKSEEERRRLIERLEHLSRTDGLTGLMNRRALTDSLSYEIDRAKRYRSELSLILCDIDNFKEINDTYGHDIGDRALQMTSATLKTILRKIDIAGRYGGDEFMLILPGTSQAGAESLADKILYEIRNTDLRVPGEKVVRLSMSIGISCMSGGAETIDSLVKRADDAMYNSKQGGRDRASIVRSDL